jgi:uroporphyrinogen decarboxylase
VPPEAPSYPLIEACLGRPVPFTPVWIMRQAGRYLPEYRKLRERYSFWEMCRTPELAARVTLQPIDRLGVDGAILFSDILVPLDAMGVKVDFVEGTGPVIDPPLREPADLDRLRLPVVEEDLAYVFEAIRLLRRELEGRVPLIGFAGAPFTLASYLVEGGSTKNHLLVKQLMFREPAAWDRLMRLLSATVTAFLSAQIAAGAQVVQMFDSWAGVLAPEDYRRFVLPYSRQVIEALKPLGVPIIHFAVGSAGILRLMAEAGSHVLGLDWRIDLDAGRRWLGEGVAVQGNLDPICLFLDPSQLRERVRDILERNGGRPGHVFNLGHGILPQTDPDQAKVLVEAVHELSAR